MRFFIAAILAGLTVVPLGAQTSESIVVERIIIDAYVVDLVGNPIPALTPADFRLRIDGKPAEIEAVDWVGTTMMTGDSSSNAEMIPPPIPAAEPRESVTAGPEKPEGRLIVLFFQTDFGRANQRIVGQMAMIHYSQGFLETVRPEDHVAVLQFDSHLKLLQDFTDDMDAVRIAIRKSLFIDNDTLWMDGGQPPIGISEEAARKATRPEQALALIGNGLRDFPGAKSLIFFGWGVGYMTRGGVLMDRSYPQAVAALAESRTAVFALDMGGESHTLALGLSKVATDTGGWYQSTYYFPKFAIEKLERTISGHYEIIISRQASGAGVHEISLELR
ncbi:MAG TPA: VWA domain-containing protein, partial [Thermoanaerobaculia bacterium]|nr:VWA domain-containing protein [Thermoanaerobaculia bacterium]